MKEIKNDSLKLNESLIIEDFKRACKRVENHETRSLRVYLLIISGFAVILSLGQKIEPYFIPIMLNLFLWITFNFAVTDRRLKYFAQSYLLNTYYNDYKTINYENYFHKYNFKEPTKYGWWKKIQKIFHPLLVIYIFGLSISTIYAYPFIIEICQNNKGIYWISYLLVLLFLHFLIIGKLYVLYTHDFSKTNKTVKEIHRKHHKKETSS